jgi:thiol:disulfide interchange protein
VEYENTIAPASRVITNEQSKHPRKCKLNEKPFARKQLNRSNSDEKKDFGVLGFFLFRFILILGMIYSFETCPLPLLCSFPLVVIDNNGAASSPSGSARVAFIIVHYGNGDGNDYDDDNDYNYNYNFYLILHVTINPLLIFSPKKDSAR